MIRIHPAFRASALLVVLLAGMGAAGRAATAPEDAWALAERFDFNGALSALDAAGADEAAAAPDLRLARAGALLGAQPRTPANIAAALAAVRALAADPAKPATSRVAARYLEGRILVEHLEPRTPENLATARAIFRELVDSGSAEPLAIRAALPLALGLLNDEPRRPRAERLAAAEALLPLAARHPAVERDMRYVIAHAAMRWNLDPRIARDHFRRVEEIGFSQLPRRLNVRIALGRLAEETGDLALAARAYEAFLAEAVRDSREGTVRARLAEINRQPATPAAR